jgi:hypothetical protein
MPHMLDVGLSSTDRIASFFGIAPHPAAKPSATPVGKAPKPRLVAAPDVHPKSPPPSAGVQKVIEDALRSAGLMR